MTPLDQEIDGGLGRFRETVPVVGTALGTAQEPPPEPPQKQLQNQPVPGVVPAPKPAGSIGGSAPGTNPGPIPPSRGSIPAKAYGLRKTPTTRRKRNPDSRLDGRDLLGLEPVVAFEKVEVLGGKIKRGDDGPAGQSVLVGIDHRGGTPSSGPCGHPRALAQPPQAIRTL